MQTTVFCITFALLFSVVLSHTFNTTTPGSWGDGEHCNSCTHKMTEIIEILGNNATMQHLEDTLKVLCLLLPVNEIKHCKELVTDLISTLESTDKKLIEDYTPQQFCSVLGFCETYCCGTSDVPQEVHISITSDPTIINVMWLTQLLTPNPTVIYGSSPNSLTLSAQGTSRTYTWGGWNGNIYLVKLSNLQPSTTYWYKVGDPNWTFSPNIYSFTTPPLNNPPPEDGEYTFATYGDMGATNVADPNLYWLINAAYTHDIDVVLHVGDISYADGYQPDWDLFLQKVEPIAAKIPYMVSPGNHEAFFDFAAYRYRFEMPTPVQNIIDVSRENLTLYYSYNYGHVHIISLSAESYWGEALNLRPGKAQYNWLENDLIEATNNRQNQPWIVVMMHRPFYCTCTDSSRCVKQASYYRGLVENLFYQYKVDLVITGHVHNYERTLPVYDTIPQGNWTSSDLFVNPTAPIYAVVGTGGNNEGAQTNYVNPPPAYAVPSSRIGVWGFGLFTVNSTSLSWEFKSADDGSVLDSFAIVKQ